MKKTLILIADDNPTFLGTAARFLEAHSTDGLEVVGMANGGKEALALAQKLHPHVILVDLAMPDLSGLEVIPILRETLPEIGIIALTLLDTTGYQEAAMSAGADAFVPKATLTTDLLPAIQQLRQRSQIATET